MWAYGVVIYLRSSSFWDVEALYVVILLPTVRDNLSAPLFKGQTIQEK